MADEDTIAAYYDRLSRWPRVMSVLGDVPARLNVHRALADPRASGRATLTRIHDVIIDYLPPMQNPRVLDAGCGLGGTMLALVPRLGGRYVGITVSAPTRRASLSGHSGGPICCSRPRSSPAVSTSRRRARLTW